MIVIDDGTLCSICEKQTAIILCDGCGKPLCRECRHFDLWAYGCGHIDPKVFCLACLDDTEINPWGGKRP